MGLGSGSTSGLAFLTILPRATFSTTDGGRLEETSRRSFQRRLSRFGNSENKKGTDSDEAEVDSHATYRSQKSGDSQRAFSIAVPRLSSDRKASEPAFCTNKSCTGTGPSTKPHSKSWNKDPGHIRHVFCFCTLM